MILSRCYYKPQPMINCQISKKFKPFSTMKPREYFILQSGICGMGPILTLRSCIFHYSWFLLSFLCQHVQLLELFCGSRLKQLLCLPFTTSLLKEQGTSFEVWIGPFINDVTQMWPKIDPLSPCSHLHGYLTYTFIPRVTKVSNLFPLLAWRH